MNTNRDPLEALIDADSEAGRQTAAREISCGACTVAIGAHSYDERCREKRPVKLGSDAYGAMLRKTFN